MANQRTLFWDEEPLALDVLGEKPFKLMQFKQAKFPVPDFFTIVADGSGRIHIDDFVQRAYGRLQQPIIARSAHPMEGGGFSFSGRFHSIGNVVRLVDSSGDELNYISPCDRRESFPEGTNIFEEEDKWFETRTFSLERAYQDIVDFANPDGRSSPSNSVKEYLEQNNIQGFNHNDMNLLVMEQRKIDVFGMFLTSDQSKPNETIIHFQDRRRNNGGWAVYDKETGKLRGYDGELEETLEQFGDLARRVQQHSGKVQQIEIGKSNKGVELYQARDINLESSAPRFAHYKTLSVDLRTEGTGYFHLPVLVIDALGSIHSKHFSTKEETIAEAVNPYRQQIKTFMEQNPEFIAVVKDAEIFTGHFRNGPRSLFETREEAYKELNAITKRAKVVFRGKCQNAVRHEDWNFVESGGINIWMTEREQMANLFIHNQIVGSFAEGRARDYAAFGETSYVAPNVTLVDSRAPIRTGDYIHVLANKDGTFVWR